MWTTTSSPEGVGPPWGAPPVDDRTGTPDDTYLRYTGTRGQLHTGWYAAGDGDAATWHVLVHG